MGESIETELFGQNPNPIDPITPTSRPPVGIVARMAQQRERRGSNSSATGGPPPPPSSSGGRDAATIIRIQLAKDKARRARQMSISQAALSKSNSTGSSIGAKDKYENDNRSTGSNSIGRYNAVSTNTSAKGKPVKTVVDSTPSTNSSSSYVHIGLPSLLSQDDATIESSDQEIKDTELFQKFEEAFNMTIRNNPGILPGAPTVIDSIKHALYKVRKTKAQKETEMRKQLEKVKADKDQLEAQLRKEMGTTAMRRSELAKELEVLTKEKCMLQDSLAKQLEAVKAMKQEMQLKSDSVTQEKEGLTKHLDLLSKSRAELEQVLEKEMELVEKDRDALQTVVAERKKLQKQKADNKEMESKIERMTEAANKEKKALQAEVAELKRFEEHIQQMKIQNEEARQSLEKEKVQLKDLADVMQTKKLALMESKTELETQYQKEIDDLQGQIENTKVMHEKDMEMVVKNRVMSYLRRGADDKHSVSHHEGGAIDIESIIKSRVEDEMQAKMKLIEDQQRQEEEKKRRQLESELMEAELQRRVEEQAAEMLRKRNEEKRKRKEKLRLQIEELDDDITDDDGGSEGETKSNYMRKKISVPPLNTSISKEDEMKKEIDRLREELHAMQTRNPRNTTTSSSIAGRGGKDEVREEIEHLRDEIKMSHAMAATSAYLLPSPSSASTPRARSTLISPRYTLRSPGRGVSGGRYFREEDNKERPRRVSDMPHSRFDLPLGHQRSRRDGYDRDSRYYH